MRGVSWLLLAALAMPAAGANLAPDAAYTVTIQGFADGATWQGPADTFSDGKRDGDTVRAANAALVEP